MMIQGNTILITGGGSGIGLELAKELCLHNKVLVCGRSLDKLLAAKRQLPNIEVFACDISLIEECKLLFDWVQSKHPKCNILINNAALAHRTDFVEDPEALQKAHLEFATNILAPITLCKLFIPLLSTQVNAKIFNISTGLIYAPRSIYPFYNATKAALHAFTQVLRIQMEKNPIQVIEVMLPVVDTPWHKGPVPKIAITAEKAVDEMLRSWDKNLPEIKVGKVKLLYWLSRLAPQFALRKINSVG